MCTACINGARAKAMPDSVHGTHNTGPFFMVLPVVFKQGHLCRWKNQAVAGQGQVPYAHPSFPCDLQGAAGDVKKVQVIGGGRLCQGLPDARVYHPCSSGKCRCDVRPGSVCADSGPPAPPGNTDDAQGPGRYWYLR